LVNTKMQTLKSVVVVLLFCLLVIANASKSYVVQGHQPYWNGALDYEELDIEVGDTVSLFSNYAVHNLFIGAAAVDNNVEKNFDKCNTDAMEATWYIASCSCASSPNFAGCTDAFTAAQTPSRIFPGYTLTSCSIAAANAPAGTFLYDNQVTFTAEGTYYLACTEFNHCLAGMKIRIDVTEKEKKNFVRCVLTPSNQEHLGFTAII